MSSSSRRNYVSICKPPTGARPTSPGSFTNARASIGLHFHLDLRRPEPRGRTVGVGSPGVRQRLAELVADYLTRRPLDADLDRERLVALGRGYLDEVERALLEGES